MSYIDGFVVAVPTENKQAYLEHAKLAGSIFKEYGALQIIEAWGDDVPSGEITSFPLAVIIGLKPIHFGLHKTTIYMRF